LTTEVYDFRQTVSGKRGEGVKLSREVGITKWTEPGAVEAHRGNWRSALRETNVTTQLKTARGFDVIVTGKDGRGKARRFKASVIVPRGYQHPERLLNFAVTEAMRRKGFRTTYPMSAVPKKHFEPLSVIRKRKQLDAVRVKVTVRR
jgi:hypothetical protein